MTTTVEKFSSINQSEYLELSKRTLGDNFFSETEQVRYLTHSGLGLSSELGELNKALAKFGLAKTEEEMRKATVNIVEELGDIKWYNAIPVRISLVMTVEGHEIMTEEGMRAYANQFRNNELDHFDELEINIADIADQAKRALFYGAPINWSIVAVATLKIEAIVGDILGSLNVTMERCNAVNINKLFVRFPDKFESEKAINRDLDKEERSLEESVGH